MRIIFLDALEASLRWAERLGQSKAYAAHYVAVSEAEGAEFWSADRRLSTIYKAKGSNGRIG